MAAFPSQQLYLNQIANSRQMGRMQYKAMQRQRREALRARTIISSYMTGQAMLSTFSAQRSGLQQLAEYQNALDLYQAGVQLGQASNPQDSLSGTESGRISKSFDQEAKRSEVQSKGTQEAVRETPKLTWESSPLFGRSQFGMFYNWTTASPFAGFERWMLKKIHHARRA
jgi:hypothetical protein